MRALEGTLLVRAYTPIFDKEASGKVTFPNNHCRQVHGCFDGTFVLRPGERIVTQDLALFCEHAINS